MAIILKLSLNSESETKIFAQKLAKCCASINNSVVIYLDGDLGAGKTTMARSFIQYFGFDKVKSPTYSLVESYQNTSINIHHFDCYRLSDPEELEYIGIREYLQPGHIQLIEWAELGKGMISTADIVIKISGNNNTREINITSESPTGKQLLQCIN